MNTENVNKKESFAINTKTGTLEDLTDAAGTTGVWNYVILFFCAWGSFVAPWHSIAYQFLGATPPYWCHVNELVEANWTTEQIVTISVPHRIQNLSRIESCTKNSLNYSIASEIGYDASIATLDDLLIIDDYANDCNKRHFDETEPITVVSMFDLVCNRRALYSTTQSAVMAGNLVGSLFLGYLVHMFGRKRVLVLLIPVHVFVGMVTIFSPNVFVYIVLKFLISVIGMGYFLAPLILGMELSSTSQRSWFGAFFGIPYAFGTMGFAVVAYYIRTFFYLQAAITLVVLTLLPLIWVVPESPRWLVQKGRFKEAISVYRDIARKNNRFLPSDDEMFKLMERIHNESRSPKSDSKLDLKKFFSLMLLPKWCWRVPVIFFVWIATSMVYYGVTLNPPNLSHGKYMYIFTGGVLDLPACLIMWPMSKYLGRKPTMIIFLFLCTVSMYGAMGIGIYFKTEENMTEMATIFLYILSFLGKLSIGAAAHFIWVYSTEVFPTHCRSLMVGECSCVARFGSIFSPYIVDLLGSNAKWAPSAIFASVALVAGLLFQLLPETKDETLAENLEADDSQMKEDRMKNSEKKLDT